MPLALRARSAGLERADVHAALNAGELVIGWLNRGTLHMVCREDYGWLHALTAPTTTTMNARRLAEEGVTDPARGVKAIAKLLAGGPLLRREIGERIGAKAGALTHLLLAASLEGLIVRGPVRGREQTFALTRDVIGELPRVDRDQALAELARRYLAGHAPATEADLAYWSGLPLRYVRAGMSASPTPRPQAGASASPTPRVRAGGGKLPPRLLPPFDPYILGWKDRSFAIPDRLRKQVMPGGGTFRAVVLVDGVVEGTWSRSGGRVKIDSKRPIAGLGQEVADVERFLA